MVIATMNKSAETSPLLSLENTDVLRRRLIHLSVRGLQNMYNEEENLFSLRAHRKEQGIQNVGLSRRYTLISLIGLNELEKRGGRSPINVPDALSRILQDTGKIDNIGDLGFLLWLIALASPDMVDRVWSELKIQAAFSHYRGASQGRTMELAWFLSGLAHVKFLQQKEGIRGLDEIADRTCRHLLQNYGGKGIFRHIGKSTSTGFIRGRIGNFADQVYPIYALSKFSHAFGSRKVLDVALECAKAICILQGPHGQWWWHYDSVSGRVIGRYPVYSVHQDGMAPMALSAVGEATGIDFRKPIFKGLRWIEGNNELGVSMIDPARNVIWRCFKRNKYISVASELLTLVRNSNHQEKKYKNLRIKYECRSYHLGWLLYAFAKRPPSEI
jgi:hypothetical protein